MKGRNILETEVLVIGGGATGTGVMRDLALRGIQCMLVDRSDLNAGASGGNHGLLHSGGRYAATDSATAAECRREAEILKRVAANCIDDCGGMFAAVDGDDVDYAERFPGHCLAAGIHCETITAQAARELEPDLSDRVFAAFTVPDATIDPFRITLENVNHAQQLTGSHFLPDTELLRFERKDALILSAICHHRKTGAVTEIRAHQYVNAAGAWSMSVARLAGCTDVNLVLSKGTLVISNSRITERVINRLRPAGDGDILVPGGTVSLLGTTSDTVDTLQSVAPTVSEVERNLASGTELIPALASTRFVRAFSGVRPLLLDSNNGSDARQLSRGFRLFDHASEGLENLATIAGGKLTTFRLMAEKTSDLVAKRLGNREPCKTGTECLPSADPVRWTEPGFAPRYWYQRQDPTDAIVCECEMVPESAIDSIMQSAPGMKNQVNMHALGVRSRIGKGSCQGSFCSMRVNSFLYDRQLYDSQQGLHDARDFVSERFHGVRPVLWGEQMPQLELAEALHCGLMGLDLLKDPLEDPV